MAIVVNQAPADISFSRNPIIYDLQANDVVETAGVAAINTISFTSAVTATTVISVRYNGQEVRFVGAAVPDASGNQIPLSATPDAGYVASLIPYFQNNYYLDPDFTVTSSGTNLILTAKKKGTAYNLLAGNYQSGAIAQTTAGVDEVRKKNHSIYVEINLVDDADNLTKIYGQPYETDTDGRAKVDISKMLHAQLQADLPPLNGDKAQKCILSNRRYALRIAPAFGEPFNIGILTKLATKRVLLGGTPYEDGPALTPVSITQKAFSSEDIALRLGDTVRDTRTDQPQYLTFLNARATTAENLRLIAQLYFSDNTSQTVTGITTINGIGQNQTVQFATGFADLNLSSYESPTKIVTRYTLQLTTTAGAARSAIYTYNVEREWKPYARHFVYVNSLGVLETVLTFGKGSETWAFVKQSAEKYLAQNYKLTDGQSLDYDLQADVKFEVASGWLRSKREVRQFADMFLSRWKYRRHNGADLPISVNTKEIKLAPDGDGRHAVGFEYQYHFSSNLLSSDTLDGEWFELIPPPFSGGGANTTWAWTVEHDNETDVPAWVLNISQQDIANWNTAFSWGNHAGAGYLLAADAALEYATNLRVDSIEERVEILENELDEILTVPADPSDFERVGAVDEETGLYRLPTIATNSKGLIVDKDDNTLENKWFKWRGQLSELDDVLALFPTNTLSAMPLAAQNGVSVWWRSSVQTLINAPQGIVGEADVIVETVGKTCKVTIRNNGAEIYNYTHNITGTPPSWSGWKYVPTLTQLAEIGKLFKATGPQTMAQANIWANEDGTFSLGQQIQFASAVLSIAGRMAGYDPLLPDDYVTLRRLLTEIATRASQIDFAAFQQSMYYELLTKSNVGHGHAMGEITGLIQEFQNYLNKGVFGGGLPYYSLVRDADGNATMADKSGTRLLIEELPAAQQGVAYSYIIQSSLFVWPAGSVNKEVVITCAKRLRGSLGWATITNFDSGTGVTISGTPTDNEDTVVVIKMKYRLHPTAKDEQQLYTLPLAVYPADAVVTIPSPVLSFVATTVSSSEISLTWLDNSSNETGFEIDYRINDTGDWIRLVTKQAGAQSHSHTGLTANTNYYYRIRAINGAGGSDYEYNNATTNSVITPPTFSRVWVAGTARLKNTGTIITPPTIEGGNFYGDGRPKINYVMQSNAAVQADWVVWKNRNTGALASFPNFDQNNNPSQAIPDAAIWEVYDIPEATVFIDRARRMRLNGIAFAYRWELLQVSATRYMFEIPAWIAKKGYELGVKIWPLIIPGIGTGGRPARPDETLVFGLDQSAQWRYLLEDVAQAMIFAGESGATVNTLSYGKTLLPPSLFSVRAKANFKSLLTAYVNYFKNDPYRAALHDELEMILSPTGETHVAIDDGKWADASPMALSAFKSYLNTLSTAKQALFGDFVNDINQRDFMRGWTSTEAYQIYDWWMQEQYMLPYQTELSNIVRAAGFKWAANHGSLSDHANDRVNKYFLDARFTAIYDTVKHNPAGFRYTNKEYGGAIEQHVARAAGKKAVQELTPGALHDFGNSISTSIAACTKASKDAQDAGADALFYSFVAGENEAINILKPIIDELFASGYANQPVQQFTPVQNINVDLSYIFGKSWYQESEANARPAKDMNDAIAALVAGGMSRKQAIQRVGFTILPTQSPAGNIPVLPNIPIVVWADRVSSNGINIRYTNQHTATALIEINAREVGTSDWYIMRNDGVFVLSTASPMQLSTGAGASSTLSSTASFYTGKVVEFRVRAIAGGNASPWSVTVAES